MCSSDLRALVFALVGGLAIVVCMVPIREATLALLGGTPAVSAAARDYVGVRLAAAPVTLAGYAVFGWFLGRGRAGTALALQTLLNLTNIALAILLGLFAGHGVVGIATAGVAAETIAALAGLVLILREGRGRPWPARGRVLDRAA